MAELPGPGGGTRNASPKVCYEPEAGDLREEVGGGMPVGWGSDLRGGIRGAEKPEAGRHGSWKHQVAVLPPTRQYLH